jgi:hypothetical protein
VRVEIVKELDPGDDTLEIPWASPTQLDWRYIDLKTHPEEIARLQECRNYPALADFLRKLNSASCPFRTAKCDVWSTAELAEDERLDFKLPFKVGSYVDLLFDHPHLNSQLEPHLQLGERLGKPLGDLRLQAQMEICLRRCLFHSEERWGYYLTIFVHAYSATPQEAEEEWNLALDALGEALVGTGQLLCRVPANPAKRGPSP